MDNQISFLETEKSEIVEQLKPLSPVAGYAPFDYLQTPEWVYSALQPFDLDPCAGINTNIAIENWCDDRNEDGLAMDWKNKFIWCNPPYSRKSLWISKMIEHGNGIMLLPERGSSPWFCELIAKTGAYFILGKKINFIGYNGSNNIGSCLFPFGEIAKNRLLNSGLPGHFVNVILVNKRGA